MATRITLLENENACLWFYPDTKIIHHRFLHPVSDEAFRNVLLTGLRLLRDNGAQKWLSDDRNNSILSVDDGAWAQNYWEPLAIKAGWKFWAVLPPIKARGNVNMQRLIDQLKSTKRVTTKIFSDPDEAWLWLAQQSITDNQQTSSRKTHRTPITPDQ